MFSKTMLLFFASKIIFASFAHAIEEGSASLTIQLSELQQELQRLNGRVEELEHKNQQLEKKVDNLIPGAVVPPQELKTLADPPLNLEQKLPDGNTQEEYERAIQLLRSGEYKQARQLLEDFIQNHPKEELIIQAHYWCGMSYFLEKNYKKAAATFAENYQKYPKSPKMFDSLLRLAQSLGALGKTKDACATLDELLSITSDKKIPLRDEAEKERVALGCAR